MWIIGISVALVALTVPLNRLVGRTFVPSEDMNEFTVHADTPQGTSIEGTTEIARNLVKEIGDIDGVSQIAYLAGAGLRDDPKGPLFRTIGPRTGLLTRTVLPQGERLCDDPPPSGRRRD